MYRGYFMSAHGYECYLQAFNSISREWVQQTSDISSWTREDNIHIHQRACNILFYQWNTKPFHFNIFICLKGHSASFCACAAILFLILRNSFQSWYLWEYWLILKTCLVIHERFMQHILCFELSMVEKYDVLKGVFSKRVEMKATFTLKSASLGEKTKRKTNERWEDEYRKL